ncbi:hypothetical protein ALC57_06133, partial [Trachymyrmex cornetzi]
FGNLELVGQGHITYVLFMKNEVGDPSFVPTYKAVITDMIIVSGSESTEDAGYICIPSWTFAARRRS